MKKLFLFLLAGVVASTVFLSCKDKFNEESFLRLQAKLKRSADSAKAAQAAAATAAATTAANTAASAAQTAQTAALNAAGLLASLTIQVLDDRTPLAGVAVVLTNTGATNPTATATSDANGNAVFSSVAIGGVTATLSKTGYATAEIVLDLGTIAINRNYITATVPGPNGSTVTQIVPVKQAVAAIVPLFATTGAATATIRGNVQIETDLTNATFEIPQGLTLLAGVVSSTTDPTSLTKISGNGTTAASFVSYNFSSGVLGTAAVNNTTGAYSMTVPAATGGLNVIVTAPVISATQTMWINSVGSGTVASATTRVKRTDLPGTFDLNTNPANASPGGLIPAVVGATVAFTAPPPSGVGFNFDFTAIGRNLDAGGSIAGANTVVGNTNYQLGSRGSAYNQPPTIAVSGTTPVATSPATAGPQMTFYATGLTITNAGTGYTNGAAQIDLVYTAGGTDYAVNNIPITIAGGSLPATVSIPGAGIGFVSNNQATTNAGFGAATAFKWKLNGGGAGTGAVIDGTWSGDVNGVIITPGNALYTTAPTFTFSAGTAAFSILEFRTQWYAAISATAPTVPYKVRPTAINLNYAATTYSGAQGPISTINTEASNGAISGPTTWIGAALTGDGTTLVSVLPNTKFRTAEYSAVAPTIAITNPTRTTFAGTLNFSGLLTTTGQISSITVTNNGSGYDVAPVVSFAVPTGAPGTGATIPVLAGTTDPNTRIFTYGGATPVTVGGGTGYWSLLNRGNSGNIVNPTPLSPTVTTFSTKPGQTYILNLNYGSGSRFDNVYN